MSSEQQTWLYCSVRFRGMTRDYAYLTRDEGLRAGDFVSASFGKNDRIRVGEVQKVERCTAETAPFPPERTKWILEKVPKPEDWDTPRERPPQPKKSRPAYWAKPQPPEEKRPEEPIPAPAVKPEPLPSPEPAPAPVPPPKQGSAQPKRNRLSWQTWVLVLAIAAFLCGGTVLFRFLFWQSETYRSALLAMDAGDYSAAEDAFLELSKYRDAPSFAIYCKYAGMEPDRAVKADGDWHLERLTLRKETAYQSRINALAGQISRHREEMEAAAEAERQAALEEQCRQDYPGKEPAVGMYMDYLQYTAFGRPREYVKSEGFDSPRVSSYDQTITVRWYTPGGLLRAYGVCRANRDGDFVLKEFRVVTRNTPSHSGLTYGGTSSSGAASGGSTASGGSGSNHPGSAGLRDEYDSPEDLWEDNRDYYESEDEAWDDWYDD